ncbi:MAG: hypothetical protein HYT98_02895 [Candidatus Sungbacteria bacterium]|nr:hypothetical protein [Candidatus Sungbacteria bacterium]
MNYRRFVKYISYAAWAHQKKVLPTAKAFRTFPSGEKSPYFTHSLWCAMMLWLDSGLPETVRYPGAQALLFHDILEDTSTTLPIDVSDKVKHLVQEMTYRGGFNEEKTAVLTKPPLIQLLKLYDKTATLYDGDMKPGRVQEWTGFMEKLITTVEIEYGTLNIVLLARELIKKYRASAQ